MTREEAIKWLTKLRNFATKGSTVYRALDMAIEALEAQRWIPVNEKLPEKDGRYLVTCSKIGAWEVDWNIWHNDPKPSWLWEQGVTAWMPLPEPYMEDNDG